MVNNKIALTGFQPLHIYCCGEKSSKIMLTDQALFGASGDASRCTFFHERKEFTGFCCQSLGESIEAEDDFG
jgi:hypothetical protein